jgi:hypothetical protein
MFKGFIKFPEFISKNVILLYLAIGKLFIHLFVNLGGGYGFFRDEFYYIACSEHLDWGYVDQPPLSIVLLKISRLILGDSLTAIRLFPAVAGAVTLVITGLIVKKLGGGRFAQILAALSVIIVPIYLGVNNVYSMNSFDILFWALAAYVIILIIQNNRHHLWLWLGLILGLGLMNKISILWFGLGLLLGLIFTSHRKSLLTKWPWLAGLIAFIIFLPYLIWQVVHQWPTLEFIRNATTQKMAAISPVDFLTAQFFTMHPLTFPLWFCGLLYYLFFKKGRQFRILGIIYLSVLLILIINQKSRTGYLASAYPMLFASGALVLETFTQKLNWKGIKFTIIVVIILGGMVFAPLALPVLPVEKYITYADYLGRKPSTEETKKVGKLPQHYADMFGWEKMVATIANVYKNLPSEDQSQCVIFTGNYGEAGAVDFLGKKYNLPRAISGHNNYWIWGPGNATIQVVIFFGGPSEETLRLLFKEVEKSAIFTCTYCMPYENNTPIYICKKPIEDIKKIWPRIKNYD